MKKILLSFIIFVCFISICNFAYAEDTIPPAITLLGNATVAINVGDTYTDAGATALDDVDGDITSNIVINNPVNTAVAGIYTITYNVQDVALNSATEVDRTVTVNAPAPSENLIIRDGDTIIFSGAVSLPTSGVIDLNDNAGASHSINARSVLSVLHDADILSADFSISNLEYYSSFNSLYLKCITGAVTGEKCENWQYTVNNSYPGIGMDQNILSGGENIYVYFGPQYKVLLSSNTVTTAETLTVTAEEYNYQNNTWKTRTGITVGLTQSDPDNPWSPIEVKTGTVDLNGQVVFSGIPVGSYNVGIKDDFYFPTEPLTVATPPPPPSGGGGGATLIFTPALKPEFNLKKAFDFLALHQKENGSFGEDIYTDWTAIAFASSPDYSYQKEKLKKYISENKLMGALFTDYERRAMALMALGLNPYDMQGENYIGKIVTGFDGAQFGDPLLVNDDIFALIPLASAGYTVSDDIIIKDITFMLSKQKPDGSWEESVDITSAAIQALKPFDSVNRVSDALSKSRGYLMSNQKNDDGWGNIYSTSWAMQSMNSLDSAWVKSGKNPLSYFATQQSVDGAMIMPQETLPNRIWATSYVIPAVLGKSWSEILQPVSKPVLPSALITPSTPPNVRNSITVVPVEKKSEIIASKKDSPSISSTQEITTNVLSATAERSGPPIPITFNIIMVVLAGSIVLLRFIKSPK